MSEQFSSTPGPAAPGRIEIASGFDGIDAGAAPPISAAGPNGRGPTYGYGSNVIGDGEVHLLAPYPATAASRRANRLWIANVRS